MMRLFSILLLSVILAQNCGKLVIFVNYEINKKQITDQYCVNKSKPAAHCDGMCHLIKQIQKEDKKEKQDNVPVKNSNENYEIILFSSVVEDSLFDSFITGNHAYSLLQLIKIDSPDFPIFHPPTC